MDLTFKIKKLCIDSDLLTEGDNVLVGVSGGIDSTVMLHIFMQIADDLGVTVSAVHINHKLRGVESDKDEKFVRSFCKKYGVDLHTLSWKSPKSKNLQEAARKFRYSEFVNVAGRIGANKIAVAHNMNDQAETLLLNLTRGSGLEGLTGMQPAAALSEMVTLIRPLLSTSRDEIARYAKAEKIAFREDATNKTTKYSRNFIRHDIIPSLQKLNSNIISTLADTAASLRVDDEYIERVAREALYTHCHPREGGDLPSLRDSRLRGNDILLDQKKFMLFPEAIRLRVLKLAYNAQNGSLAGITRDHLLKMDSIATGPKKTGSYRLANKITFERAGDKISLKG